MISGSLQKGSEPFLYLRLCLFVFGDDFEAILGILEEDEALEEEFRAIASNVS